MSADAGLHEVAAELSATAGDIAADIRDERACPAHLERARELLGTLSARLGDGAAPGSVRAAQDRAWKNKAAKGFNVTDVPLEFCLLSGEVAEAFDAWRKGRPGLGGELADVAIFLLGLAEMTGTDLGAEIDRKLAVIEARAYAPLRNGVLVKAGIQATRRPPVVCLCGSTRFHDEFRAANLRLTLEGQIVLSIGCDTKRDGDLAAMAQAGDPAAVKPRLDELHRRKIDLADHVLVLNVGGYVGESTRCEVAYALAHGKPVFYLEPPADER